ncbi:MAG: hypothetical protein ACE5IH_00410 [Thermodesulfobacteriota bacterium]
MRYYFQHRLNALHIYCALIRIGMGKDLALTFSRQWERVVHRLIY